MTEVLTSYLLQHKASSIPGLGSLHIERIPAQTDFVSMLHTSPIITFVLINTLMRRIKTFSPGRAERYGDYEAIKWVQMNGLMICK